MSKVILKRTGIVVACLVLVASIITRSVIISDKALACSSVSQCQAEMDALQSQINIYNSQIEKLASQASTLENQIASLNVQISAVEAEISVSQARYNQLIQQINETEIDIKNNQDALGRTIADIYVEDDLTPIEILASSKSIGDYLDAQEYRSSVRSELAEEIGKIKILRDELTLQKTEVETILDRQKSQQTVLDVMRSEQQRLLNETSIQEASYQQMVSSARQRLDQAAAEQRAYFNTHSINSGVFGNFQWTNFSGNMGCSGGYPWSTTGSWGSTWGCSRGLDEGIDSWQLYNRECVSYAAWAISERFDKYVAGFSGSGMAYEWVWSAPMRSGAYRVYEPQPGDAVVLPATPGFSPVGHVMVVESYDGNWVHVSQYNFGSTGEYSTMDIKTTGVVFLRFKDKN